MRNMLSATQFSRSFKKIGTNKWSDSSKPGGYGNYRFFGPHEREEGGGGGDENVVVPYHYY